MKPTVGDLKTSLAREEKLRRLLRDVILAPYAGSQFAISASITAACIELRHPAREPDTAFPVCVCGMKDSA